MSATNKRFGVKRGISSWTVQWKLENLLSAATLEEN